MPKAWHCSVCGSKNVIISATARWDEAKQEWVVVAIDDSSDNDYCFSCDDWHHVEERDLTDLKAAARAAIIANDTTSRGGSMGYRSDVAIAIYGPEDAMVPLIAAERLKPDGVFKIDGEYIRSYPFEVQRGGERIKYHMLHAEFTGVKWYEGYPDVQAWKKLLSDIADDPDATGLAYEFVRIGEDTDDVETGYAGDVEFYLNVSRAISFDLPENTTSSEDNHDRDNASSAA